MTTETSNPKTTLRQASTMRKPSSAVSNVLQAKAKMDRNGKIGSIAHARVERGVAPVSGEPTLAIIFPRKAGLEPHHLDFSFLLNFPNLQSMFTEAFLCWGANLSPKTRISCKESLRRRFFGYINSNWSNMLHPEDIDDEFFAGFRDNLLSTSGVSTKPLHPTTVAAALSDVRSLLASLTTGSWASVASRIVEMVPPGPTGADRKSVPTRVLGMEHLLSILTAAEQEVLAIEDRFTTAQALIDAGRTRLHAPDRITRNTRADYDDFATCLAAAEEAYPGVLPKQNLIIAQHPALGNALKQTHGQIKIESQLYPSARDLVPFVLLLAVVTVFNPETILNLKWQDVNFGAEQAGTPAIEIMGTKGRAERDLVRLLDPNASVASQLSLKKMLSWLKKITSRIRPLLPIRDADCLFVYVPRGRGIAKAFGFDDGKRVVLRTGDLVWRGALLEFIENNALPPFTLGQLRPSILDLVQFMDGSLEAARKVGNHRSPMTTWTHYTSGGVRARYQERIGQIILLRERWAETNGAIDPRKISPELDKGAATPGFSCLNPFDSQRPNQQPGKLCRDYGGCPSCPMAVAYPDDPVCVGYYTALEVAIYRSQSTMSPKTWVERWAPVLSDVVALRAWISPAVLEASLKISLQLPNVG